MVTEPDSDHRSCCFAGVIITKSHKVNLPGEKTALRQLFLLTPRVHLLQFRSKSPCLESTENITGAHLSSFLLEIGVRGLFIFQPRVVSLLRPGL